jgi:membrane protease YdiL (CAAX protease family)
VIGAVVLVFGLTPLADVAAELCRRILHVDLTASKLVAGAAKAASPSELVLMLVSLAVLPALVEEMMFRGFVTLAFLRSPVSALVVPSVLFGLFHLEPTQVAGTIVLGFGFGTARLLSGSLVPASISHFIYNAAVIVAMRYGNTDDQHAIKALPIVVGSAIAALGLLVLIRPLPRASAPEPGQELETGGALDEPDRGERRDRD